MTVTFVDVFESSKELSFEEINYVIPYSGRLVIKDVEPDTCVLNHKLIHHDSNIELPIEQNDITLTTGLTTLQKLRVVIQIKIGISCKKPRCIFDCCDRDDSFTLIFHISRKNKWARNHTFLAFMIDSLLPGKSIESIRVPDANGRSLVWIEFRLTTLQKLRVVIPVPYYNMI